MTGRVAAGATVVLIGGLALATILVRPALDWPPDEPRMVAGHAVIELQGRVTAVDASAIWVAPTVLGLNARRLDVDADTRILVTDKEGGLGDVLVGALVSVIGEPRASGAVARWIGVGFEPQTLHVAAARAALKAAAPAEPAVQPLPIAPPAAPAPSTAKPPAAAASSVAQPSPTLAGRVMATPAAPARPAKAPAASAQPAKIAQPAKVPPAAAPAPRPDADDPGAVIDWLLRDSGRN